MAKGTDSDEFMMLSRVRSGLKREFAFAMKAQSEMDGSLGRTRASKNRNETPVQTSPSGKRFRKSGPSKNDEDVDVCGVMSEEEAKSDVVDLASDDEPKNHVGEESKSVFLDEANVKSDVVIDEEARFKEEEVMNEIEIETAKTCVIKTKDETIEEKETLNVEETKEVKDTLKVEEAKKEKVKKKKVKVHLDKSMRRFTRSALKQKDDETKMLSNGERDNVVGVDVNVEKENVGTPFLGTPTPMKLTKSALKRFPVKLKDLLATGILEGLPVKYIRGLKVLFEWFCIMIY